MFSSWSRNIYAEYRITTDLSEMKNKLNNTLFEQLFQMLNEVKTRCNNLIDIYNNVNLNSSDNIRFSVRNIRISFIRALDDLKEELNIKDIVNNPQIFKDFDVAYKKLGRIYNEKFEKILENFQQLNQKVSIMVSSLIEKIYNLLLDSLNQALNKQNSLYGQYKVVLDNSEEIINLINAANLNDQSEIDNYSNLGILFLKLFFGKKCILLSDKNTDEKDKEKDKINIKKLFDGFDDNSHGNINVILGEKFFVDYESDLEPLRVELCEIIIKFIEKFKTLSNILDFQFILFVLLKRIYFYYFDKFEEAITPLFVQILINLCLFKDEKINPVIQFINELLNSKNEQDETFKELLKKKIEEAKNIADFNFNPKDNLNGNLEKIHNEIIYVE
jgi:hypothetical protein